MPLPTQVFGCLLSTPPNEDLDEGDSPEAGDVAKEGKEDEVREHVVDILFSKGKISSIQKQVQCGLGALSYCAVSVRNCDMLD